MLLYCKVTAALARYSATAEHMLRILKIFATFVYLVMSIMNYQEVHIRVVSSAEQYDNTMVSNSVTTANTIDSKTQAL